MSASIKVALAGATGNLGPAILKALLDAGFSVTVLTRSPNPSLPQHQNQTVKVVDYSSKTSLEAALKGVNVVVSNVAIQAIASQRTLIDASIVAGVERFFPSEFGNDIGNPLNAAFPLFEDKIVIRKYLKEASLQHPTFSYTNFLTEAFFDWGIEAGFLVDAKGHTATLYDGGDRPFSVTRLSTIGLGIVKVIQNLELTKNQDVFVHDGTTTQNKIIEVFKRVDGKEWSTQVRDTSELIQWAHNEWSKPDGPDKNPLGAAFAFIYAGAYREGYGGDFRGRTWNSRLGIKELSDGEIEEVTEEIAKNFKGDFTLPQLRK